MSRNPRKRLIGHDEQDQQDERRHHDRQARNLGQRE